MTNLIGLALIVLLSVGGLHVRARALPGITTGTLTAYGMALTVIPAALAAVAVYALDIPGFVIIALAAVGGAAALLSLPSTAALRKRIDRIAIVLLAACAGLAIIITLGIVLSLLFEALRFFSFVAPWDFFFGTVWDPRFSSSGDMTEVGQFGLLPLLWGTLYISVVALLLAVPIGLLCALYLAEYATYWQRATLKPALEVLAGIPTVVYGFFALVVVGPAISNAGDALLGIQASASNALAAGLVLGVMLIPFVSSLSDDMLVSVPRSMRDGALALGATRGEALSQVILPAAAPGIAAGILLAASRAVGETMIVVMAAGIVASIDLNPFASMTTITVKIVHQLTGDQVFNSPQSLVAFALGLTLFVMTLAMNVIALQVVRKHRRHRE